MYSSYKHSAPNGAKFFLYLAGLMLSLFSMSLAVSQENDVN